MLHVSCQGYVEPPSPSRNQLRPLYNSTYTITNHTYTTTTWLVSIKSRYVTIHYWQFILWFFEFGIFVSFFEYESQVQFGYWIIRLCCNIISLMPPVYWNSIGVSSVAGTWYVCSTQVTWLYQSCRGWWLISVTLLLEGWYRGHLEGGAKLGVAGHVEPASALSPASTWAPCRSTWCPGGLRSREPGQAGDRTAQTGRVGQ